MLSTHYSPPDFLWLKLLDGVTGMAVDLQLGVSDSQLPSSLDQLDQCIESWVSATLAVAGRGDLDLTVRLVDTQEMTQLNHKYRGRNSPTNVLAFPFENVAEVEYSCLGDIVICLDIVKIESNQLDRAIQNHFAHMVVHGTLHLCGFDHQDQGEAEDMESREQQVLAEFGLT